VRRKQGWSIERERDRRGEEREREEKRGMYPA
jgi:hypothetical protein